MAALPPTCHIRQPSTWRLSKNIRCLFRGPSRPFYLFLSSNPNLYIPHLLSYHTNYHRLFQPTIHSSNKTIHTPLPFLYQNLLSYPHPIYPPKNLILSYSLPKSTHSSTIPFPSLPPPPLPSPLSPSFSSPPPLLPPPPPPLPPLSLPPLPPPLPPLPPPSPPPPPPPPPLLPLCCLIPLPSLFLPPPSHHPTDPPPPLPPPPSLHLSPACSERAQTRVGRVP